MRKTIHYLFKGVGNGYDKIHRKCFMGVNNQIDFKETLLNLWPLTNSKQILQCKSK